jgi:hypothetical protein
MIKLNHSIGKTLWAFSAGHIPLRSTGREPALTSHDKFSVLNTSDQDADLVLKIFYEDSDPVQEYKITVKARRVRKIRVNDLIDPFPVPLDTPYGFVVESSTKVIIQFSRMDTSSREAAAFVVTPYSSSL